ncbi:single-stranded DNA-binding protein [Synechococcus sp. RSCCF101]|uniref:single-stranded DNA-binding protein n=1 Tax=Synechococcus sp. RSCCF101 TaxID=2511069 RepID=UPI0012477719|nr:single-stranded DNA-binding protein [Synechococcus sp. RSCCF101]QEY31392.1 single-stranded DNA-binding protein [Synechococcus sp. RSCCF101]
MNHTLLEVTVLEAPQVRFTQDNQTPIGEMTVSFDGLRPDDPPGRLKVVGWGNLAQDLQNRVQVGQRLLVEGRLRMSTLTRSDGMREKRAELTLSRLHPLSGRGAGGSAPAPMAPAAAGASGRPGQRPPAPAPAEAAPTWNAAPLVPDDPLPDEDEIPF